MMNTPTRFGAVAFSLVLVGLQGCTTLGESDFACPGRPTGVRCASAVEVYQLTEGTDQIQSTSDEALGDDPEKAAKKRAKQEQRVADAKQDLETAPVDVKAVPPSSTPVPEMPRDSYDGQLLQASTGGMPIRPLVHKPIPVRTPAQVMRVWIAPWEDAKGVLHIGGYHFIEIQARRWTFGEQGQVQPVRMFSIQEPYPEAADTGGESQPAEPVAARQVGMTEKRKSQ